MSDCGTVLFNIFPGKGEFVGFHFGVL
jgi:hypothetical protein